MKIFCAQIKLLILFFFIGAGFVNDSFSFSPEPKIPDSALEARALEIFTQIRCLACAGQAIDSSDSQFAFNLRQAIREKVQHGKTNQEIKDDLVESFGPEILLSPPKPIALFILIVSALLGAVFVFFVKKPSKRNIV